MGTQTSTYSQRHLITVAEVASAIAVARGTAGLEELRWLAQQAANGGLTAGLYPPHQQWQHGGNTSRIGTPATNSAGIWRTMGAKAAQLHMSDKDAFNYPAAASTWHLLACDVFEFASCPALSGRAAAALRELAARYSPELADEAPAPEQPQAAARDAWPAASTEEATNPAWSPNAPRRSVGYTYALYRTLLIWRRAGRTRPTARQILEMWREDKPQEIAKVLTDGFDYYDANGDTKGADVRALQKAIGRMTDR